MSIAELMRDVKASSSNLIDRKGWVAGKFQWQRGYGAFSHSRSHIRNVCAYVKNQEAHHRVQTFKDEYLKLLDRFNVDYEYQYLFDWIEDPHV